MRAVKLLTTMAGPGGCYHPGDVVSLPAEKAEILINGGYAEAVKLTAIETAAVETPEKAVLPKAQSKRRARKKR